jgi:nucleoside-diphosphate-sugar epimerase
MCWGQAIIVVFLEICQCKGIKGVSTLLNFDKTEPYPQSHSSIIIMSTEFIAVTGANGFLGSHVVDQLLSQKTKTRAIVRSSASADILRQVYADQVSSGLLEFAYVPDISAETSNVYDEAFVGVTGLIHTASPIFQLGGITEDREARYLKPAINGALNALRAANRSNTIKKVLLTSSVTAATPPGGIGEIMSDYYPPITYEEALKLDDDRTMYSASKVLAEKAAWDLIKKENPKFSLTALLVGLILGPNIQGKSDPTGSNGIYLAMAKKPELFVSFPSITVQDAAAAHISALRRSETNAKRLMVIEKIFFANDAIRIAKEQVHDFPAGSKQGTPEKGKYLDAHPQQDTKLLHLSFRGTDEAFAQLLRDNVA